MSGKSIESKQIIRYLLGQLPQTETDRMDELCFADEEFSARLLIIEDDLIDAYVRGQLPEGDLKRFEIKYLSVPHLRERVGFADALRQSAAANAVSPETRDLRQTLWPRRLIRAFSWDSLADRSLAAVFIIALLVGVAAIFFFRKNQNQGGQKNAGLLTSPSLMVPESPSPSPLFRSSPPIEFPSPQVIKPKPAIFILSPGTRDPAESQSLSISPKSEAVILRLKLDGEKVNRYRAILKTARDEISVWTSGRLRPPADNNQDFINVSIPTSKLASRTYVLLLMGSQENQQEETVGEYSFRILLQ